MSKKVQMKIKSVSFGTKTKKDKETQEEIEVPMLSYTIRGKGWTLSWKGEEDVAPFEIGKENKNEEVLIEITYPKQTMIQNFNELPEK